MRAMSTIQGAGGRLSLLLRSRNRVSIPFALRQTQLASGRRLRLYSSATAQSESTPLAHAPSSAFNTPLLSSSKGKEKEETLSDPSSPSKKTIQNFTNLGLSEGLSRQLCKTFPHISAPSPSQQYLVPAVLDSNDVILRSHTGSGKSFGLLLALMAKPRIVFKGNKRSEEEKVSPASHGVSSLILVPTNELAQQYVAWAKQLLPPSMASSIDSVIQCLIRGDPSRTDAEQIDALRTRPPHILVATPKRALEILNIPGGAALLGIGTLRSLALDEVDSLLDLPGRYPSAKTVWKNLQHPPPGLQFLNAVMKSRGTFSGGDLLASAGLEPSRGKIGDERRPPENIRRVQHKGNEKVRNDIKWLNSPKRLRGNEQPLQLIACSASANAVVRHFFGAKTGWLRVGLGVDEGNSHKLGRWDNSTQRKTTGKWIDLTGLSGSAGVRMNEREQVKMRNVLQEQGELGMLPAELEHCCIIVDEPAPRSDTDEKVSLPMRNFSAKRIGKSLGSTPSERLSQLQGELSSDPNVPSTINLHSRKTKKMISEVMDTRSNLDKMVVPSYDEGRAGHEIDTTLLESFAYIFVSEISTRSIVFIPSSWSLRKTMTHLEELGLPVVSLDSLRQPSSDQESKVAVLQSSQGRGLDLPNLSHVFIIGTQSLGDSVSYTHLAGRTSRLSGMFNQHTRRRTGRVISILNGLSATDQIRNSRVLDNWKSDEKKGEGKPMLISTAEKRISSIYHRLDIKPRRIKLGVDLQEYANEFEEQEQMEDGIEQDEVGSEKVDVKQGQESVATS
ncbi:unnamed protein product [Sympodiomycopsis kandeliae]